MVRYARLERRSERAETASVGVYAKVSAVRVVDSRIVRNATGDKDGEK
jgi:hypothetical protein